MCILICVYVPSLFFISLSIFPKFHFYVVALSSVSVIKFLHNSSVAFPVSQTFSSPQGMKKEKASKENRQVVN